MIDKTAVISSAVKVLSTLFGIRLQIKLMPDTNYQIKICGDGFDLTLTMDTAENFERKWCTLIFICILINKMPLLRLMCITVLDITPKPTNFNEIQTLLSQTNDICGLIINCRKYKKRNECVSFTESNVN